MDFPPDQDRKATLINLLFGLVATVAFLLFWGVVFVPRVLMARWGDARARRTQAQT